MEEIKWMETVDPVISVEDFIEVNQVVSIKNSVICIDKIFNPRIEMIDTTYYSHENKYIRKFRQKSGLKMELIVLLGTDRPSD